MPYLLALKGIGPDKLLTKETPDQVLEDNGAGAILRHGHPGDSLIGVKAEHGDESVDGATAKSLTPGEAWPCARCKHLEALDVSNAH